MTAGNGSCLVAMYHYVRDTEATAFPAIRALPPALFEQQLDWLQRHYTVIAPDQLEPAIDGLITMPANAPLLTFGTACVVREEEHATQPARAKSRQHRLA